MSTSDHAPVLRDAFQLCTWILKRLERNPGPLARALCGHAIRLVDAITLALKDRDRFERLDEADERLIAIRMQLRLAEATGLLTTNQMLFALEHADGIGRQIGGWIRSLDRA